ncbi:EAL domain-containing protein [Collimonas sp.]|jgi:EAL domain-containing protein (putative c-di-GMP-specific phosphodiesterase class I)|uniref:EAL domain-containing protein n=1 Tax=Collimonas sp. TaxID=1963772 RepID=UPI002D0C90D7|nr:EAL domain-containing protein [Collimonas sp.]HWW08438.1 EAL domain-containing protein [Collimonas sp.]
MSFPALEQYLARLNGAKGDTTPDQTRSDCRVWLDGEGRAQGRYFNTTLTSVFQPLRRIEVGAGKGAIIGHEGFAHSYSANDNGLYLWKLLDHAASDDESIELDRLCRMLHSINFYRQAEALAGDLYLSVHARLLAAVDSNHGMAFRRILNLLGLPHDRIVLQLPTITENQGWLLNYVLDNYRRNHFRLAVNADDVAQAANLLERVRPDVIKIDARGVTHDEQTARLLEDCAKREIQVIFKRLEKARDLEVLQQLARIAASPLHAQGFLWDLPQAALHAFAAATSLQDSISIAALDTGAD